jgi:ATP-dependent exoDNAse (exonuclease V) beta subunit
VEEVILPETDDDAVRIMTVHAAKGLEFPITIVSGLSTRPQNNRTRVQVVFPAEGRIGYKVGKGLITAEFKEWAPIDEQMALDERLRLLYVACTRARDHLVVSLHRAARTNSVELGSMTNAELLVSGMGGMLDGLPDGPGDAEAVAVPAPPPPPALEPFEAWSTERTAALDDASRPTTVAATALSDEGVPDAGEEVREGLEKRPRDLDLPPWLKGRYGSAVGRAVHGVLQVVDLQDGGGIEAAVAAQCEAEAIVERASDVRRLVEAALGSPSVVEAAGCAHWRELYVCVPVGERLLEGYLDLLYRRQGAGLVVVDYKTASTADPGELDRRVEGYRRQGASYALAMAEATGEEVVEVVFVFLTPRGAIERRLPDLSAAVADVRGLIASGAELVVP